MRTSSVSLAKLAMHASTDPEKQDSREGGEMVARSHQTVHVGTYRSTQRRRALRVHMTTQLASVHPWNPSSYSNSSVITALGIQPWEHGFSVILHHARFGRPCGRAASFDRDRCNHRVCGRELELVLSPTRGLLNTSEGAKICRRDVCGHLAHPHIYHFFPPPNPSDDFRRLAG
ncbi:hypothetical protein OH76DRAFT_118442 [Lentinus brumalis]|uniref:Uncharacterized protein n=1 Tax=Lentinus brumalis TaxID=2498619 RepID=A0A371DJI8_9APHY|nr:hypothetical protein OH76DRAFT_118442 [Polyporus brumalis]